MPKSGSAPTRVDQIPSIIREKLTEVSPGVYEIDPEGTRYPSRPRENWPQAQARLDAELGPVVSDLRERIAAHRERYEKFERIAQAVASVPGPPGDDDHSQLAAAREAAYEYTIWPILTAIREVVAASDGNEIERYTRFLYLAEKVLPEDFAALTRAYVSGVRVGVNLNTTSVCVDVPGDHFYMVFRHASGEDRADLAGIIRDSQVALGHPINPGGRKRRKDDPVKTERLRLAAKLSYWAGFDDPMIATVLDVSPRTVATYVSVGRDLLNRELGPDWRVHVPEKLEWIKWAKLSKRKRASS